MYKLYHSPGSCSLAVHILLEELGAPYALETVSVKEGRTQSPEFLALNPKGRVPALVVDDELLTEAPAILMYLAAAAPDVGLLPSDPMEHYRCTEWFNWLSGTVHSSGYGPYWRPQRFIENPAQHAKVTDKGKENILESYLYIEQQLAGRTWSVGSRYSCVDPFLFVFYLWGNLIGLKMRKRFPQWSAHADRVVDRDAVRRVLEQEGLPQWICVKPLSATFSAIVGKFSA